MTDTAERTDTLDTSDVDKYVGAEVGGGQLKEPVTVTDIRRWVQAMDYANPRHFDEEAAAETPAGEIIAPQSFMVCCDVGHGASAAIVGAIPESHAIFGGDEFWFFGPRIRPGDHIRMKRRFDGYSQSQTKFAGPTLFARGDTTYVNQRREVVGKQRSTMVRYRADFARERGYYGDSAEMPQWTSEKLAELEGMKAAWLASGASGEGPGAVEIGDTLPVRPIGPHTTAQFAVEYRTFMFSVWGSHYVEGEFHGYKAGWLSEFKNDHADQEKPKQIGGYERGPASGHGNTARANMVGLPRNYGYGSSMGSWVVDYVAYWAGDNAFVRHSNVNYRFPVFEGDVALIEGVVQDVRYEPLIGGNLAKVGITMLNQDDVTLAKGYVEVQLPLP